MKLKTLLSSAIACVLGAGLLLLVGNIDTVPKAQAQQDSQGQAQGFLYPTGFPTNITAGAASNGLTAPIVLHAGKGLGLVWPFNGCTNASMTLTASPDGTNYYPFTTLTYSGTAAQSTTTNIVSIGTNWSDAQLRGLYSLNISSVSNVGTIALTNKYPSAPVIVNRPN